MELPKDPMVLFSVINMKLRDIVSQLKAAGFEYSAEHNKFW